MKKLLLVPIMFYLLLSGCKDTDDDIYLPLPQEPVGELIQGKWLHTADSAAYYFDNGAANSDDKGLFFVPITAAMWETEKTFEEMVDYGDYFLTESGGKTYIELIDYSEEYASTHSKYVVTAISDSAMTWKKESGFGPDNMIFIKEKFRINPGRPVNELIQGDWYEIPVSYDNKPFMFPDTFSFFDGRYLYIYNEVYGDVYDHQYTVVKRNGKTYIDYYKLYPTEDEIGTFTFEVVTVSDNRISLKNLYDNSDPNHSRNLELIRK